MHIRPEGHEAGVARELRKQAQPESYVTGLARELRKQAQPEGHEAGIARSRATKIGVDNTQFTRVNNQTQMKATRTSVGTRPQIISVFCLIPLLKVLTKFL